MSSKTQYQKRKYSGKVNRKRVAAQLNRYYGSENHSRLSLWGQPVNRSVSTNQPSRSLQESENMDPCTSGSSIPKRRKVNGQTLVPMESNLLQVETANNLTEFESLSSNPKTYRKHSQKQVSVLQKSRMEATCTSSSQTPVTAKYPQTCKVNWPLPDPSVENHSLQIEIVPPIDNFSGLDGYRIMDIKHVLQWAFAIASHKQVCTCANIVFVKEKKHGLQSTFLFKCTMCDKQWKECSENNKKKEVSIINKSFVWGTITSGSFYTQTEHLLGIMDIPTMNAATFQKMEKQLGDIWLEHLSEEIKKAGEMEKAIAIAKGDIDDDGLPFTTVCVDGGWPKRSYGHNYKSASGMACIIGKETKRCLFLGIKNKYCFHCQYYEKKGKDVPPHQCFKNFEGPSTAMEATILVEGFQRSEEMHGMRYREFIGDGDSSVFYQLKEKVSYGMTIKKIECKNHVIKNYTNALYKILSNTKLPLTGRNMLKPKLTKLTVVARKIIMHNAGNPSNMRRDLKNGPFHVFGKHDACDGYYCRYKGSPANPDDVEPLQDEDLTDKMKKEATTVWALIIAANEAVMSKAGRLSNATTNVAENFMSVINKFNCGKRLDLCKGGSYQRRVQVAGLQHTSGYKWHNSAWRKCSPRSPGKNFQTYIARKEKSRIRQKKYSRKRLYLSGNKKQQPDENYGPAAIDPVDEIDATELKRLCLEKLTDFQKAPDEIKNIESSTIGQHDNDLYNLHRKDRLTASLFGMICKRKRSTPCHNHVKQTLYKSNFSTSDTAYGQQNESVARTIFAEKYGKTVREAGLFIDEEYGFLGASPDGVIESENAIVEIKTFPSLTRSAQDIHTAAKEKKNFPLCFKDDRLQMNDKHNYYYQVQGQLRVTKMTKCYLVCFISAVHPITVIEVFKDDVFISEMVEKLKIFFEKFVLPEIILRRIPQNAKCLEPAEENGN